MCDVHILPHDEILLSQASKTFKFIFGITYFFAFSHINS